MHQNHLRSDALKIWWVHFREKFKTMDQHYKCEYLAHEINHWHLVNWSQSRKFTNRACIEMIPGGNPAPLSLPRIFCDSQQLPEFAEPVKQGALSFNLPPVLWASQQLCPWLRFLLYLEIPRSCQNHWIRMHACGFRNLHVHPYNSGATALDSNKVSKIKVLFTMLFFCIYKFPLHISSSQQVLNKYAELQVNCGCVLPSNRIPEGRGHLPVSLNNFIRTMFCTYQALTKQWNKLQ